MLVVVVVVVVVVVFLGMSSCPVLTVPGFKMEQAHHTTSLIVLARHSPQPPHQWLPPTVRDV